MEYEAVCGCTFSEHAVENTTPGIDHCPLHKAAPLLLEAYRAVVAWLNRDWANPLLAKYTFPDSSVAAGVEIITQAAIAAAEGE